MIMNNIISMSALYLCSHILSAIICIPVSDDIVWGFVYIYIVFQIQYALYK